MMAPDQHTDYLRRAYTDLYEACRDLPALLGAAAERARLDDRPESERALGDASRRLAAALGYSRSDPLSASAGANVEEPTTDQPTDSRIQKEGPS